jgi:(p)ppGpp synthase/HD superfamily hydrolase
MNVVATKTPLFPFEREIRSFAEKMHGDQKYDSGTTPYVLHLAAVRDAVIEFGFGPLDDALGESYVAAAWLHDVVEDTEVTLADVSRLFGEATAILVWDVTGVGNNRKERNESAYQKMTKRPSSIPLKLADRICNTRASQITSPDKLFPMYVSEYPTFRTRLRGISIEFASKCLPMWRELDEVLKFEEEGKDG